MLYGFWYGGFVIIGKLNKGGLKMRFIHLSDLHIGKRVNEFSMIEDQKYILKEITDIVKNSSLCW